jgi:fimbrial chaperone protein
MREKKVSLRRACVLALAWLVAAAGTSFPSQAGSFSVNPVQISLPDGQRAASLSIKNSGAAPVSIRAQALDWSQTGGIDRYAPTSDVIVSPPIFTIAPGATQLVRVGLKEGSGGRAYRLILEEIPTQKKVAGQIQVTLRLNLPIYRLPRGGGHPDVSWRSWRSPDGILTIEGANRGTAHLQVTGLIAEQGGTSVVLSKKMGVLLPGSSRIWTSRSKPSLEPSSPFTLVVKSPAGETKTRITPEPR